MTDCRQLRSPEDRHFMSDQSVLLDAVVGIVQMIL